MDNIPLKLFQGITACATFLHWKDSSLKSIVTSRFSWGNCGINLGLRDRFLMDANGCLVLPSNVCFFILILKLKCFSTPRTSSPMPRALGGSLSCFHWSAEVTWMLQFTILKLFQAKQIHPRLCPTESWVLWEPWKLGPASVVSHKHWECWEPSSREILRGGLDSFHKSLLISISPVFPPRINKTWSLKPEDSFASK